jgi:hypothetical protein
VVSKSKGMRCLPWFQVPDRLMRSPRPKARVL